MKCVSYQSRVTYNIILIISFSTTFRCREKLSCLCLHIFDMCNGVTFSRSWNVGSAQFLRVILPWDFFALGLLSRDARRGAHDTRWAIMSVGFRLWKKSWTFRAWATFLKRMCAESTFLRMKCAYFRWCMLFYADLSLWCWKSVFFFELCKPCRNIAYIAVVAVWWGKYYCQKVTNKTNFMIWIVLFV